MNILLIGSGGREHALAWKLAQSPSLTKLYAAPGNPGIARHAQCVGLDVRDHAQIIVFCDENDINLVVIGPEQPLVDGLADSLELAEIPVFGPSKAAAQLEGSKGFTKDLCKAAGIPTAAYERFDDNAKALKGLENFGLPVVIKADGLAAGKGVVIAQTADQARAAVNEMFYGSFGDAGTTIVIEEFMTGEEVSFFALTDGTTVVPFASAQDHKRVGDGDVGPNTGGMGAYSPATVLMPELEEQVMETIVLPTIKAMADEGMPYSGVLFAGLMLTADGPRLIEYNARFGDPETQVMMMRFEGDLAALLSAVATGKLSDFGVLSFAQDAALTVVMAAKGYPGAPRVGGLISGVSEAEANGAIVFHAGTAISAGRLVANGGRAINVTAAGRTISDARNAAYSAIRHIDFPDGFYRSDIGMRTIAMEPINR